MDINTMFLSLLEQSQKVEEKISDVSKRLDRIEQNQKNMIQNQFIIGGRLGVNAKKTSEKQERIVH